MFARQLAGETDYMIRSICCALLAIGLCATACFAVQANGTSCCEGREPGWATAIVLSGNQREAIRSLPVTERPYRPLHVYGNAVRRLHYRGTVLPAPRDVIDAGAATLLRP